eukprot:107431-Amorphochlora_amoeboformis.AAC.1
MMRWVFDLSLYPRLKRNRVSVDGCVECICELEAHAEWVLGEQRVVGEEDLERRAQEHEGVGVGSVFKLSSPGEELGLELFWGEGVQEVQQLALKSVGGLSLLLGWREAREEDVNKGGDCLEKDSVVFNTRGPRVLFQDKHELIPEPKASLPDHRVIDLRGLKEEVHC